MPTARDKGSDFTPAPAGSHLARCISVISLGTQHSELFGNDSEKVMLAWELPNEKVKAADGEERPMTITKDYTLSLNKKASLRKDLEGWRGKTFTAEELNGFAVEKVLGQPCLLNIVHEQSNNGKTYAKITSVGSVPKGMPAPDAAHKRIHYEIAQGRDEVFKSLPEWVRSKIDKCLEWNGGTESPEEEESSEVQDDVPF